MPSASRLLEEGSPITSPLCFPPNFPTEVKTYSQSLFENAGQANYITSIYFTFNYIKFKLYYICILVIYIYIHTPIILHPNFVMLACIIMGFYYNSETEGWWQETLSCQCSQNPLNKDPRGQPDPITSQCKTLRPETLTQLTSL